MAQYIEVIKTAFLLFPLAALAVTLPYMVVEYKKFGAIPALRTAVVYSFILYLMTVYFLAILPLPSVESVAAMTGPRYSLVPAASVFEFLQKHPQDFSELSAYWNLLCSSAVRELFFNVCMFVPLGVYLRYYFKRRWWQALCLGFALSMFLELTQLSGLYGIYPRPYRLFDTSDLINNSLGTLVGFWLTPALVFFLPSRERLDAIAYRKGRRVPFLRRLFALCADWLLFAVLALPACAVMRLVLPGLAQSEWAFTTLRWLYIAVYFILLQKAMGGRTPGKRFFHLRLVRRQDGRWPRLWQYLVRYGLLYGLVLPAPGYALRCLNAALDSRASGVPGLAGIAGAVLFAGVTCVFAAETILKMLGGRGDYLYARASGTENISTLAAPDAFPDADLAPQSPSEEEDEESLLAD